MVQAGQMPFLALSQYSGHRIQPCSHLLPAMPEQLLRLSMHDRRLELVHLFDELRLAIEVEVRLLKQEVHPVLDLVQVVLLLKIRDDMSALK